MSRPNNDAPKDVLAYVLKLQGLGPLLQKHAVRALNRAAQRAIDDVVRGTLSVSALDETYLRRHLRSDKATASRLESRVYVTTRATLQSRYPYQQLYAPNRTKEGQKRAGVSGQILRASTYTSPRLFIIPHLKDSGVPGIARRLGKARKDIRVLHTIGPFHAFRALRAQAGAAGLAYLENRLAVSVEEALK